VLTRVLEPEVMDTAEEAADYDAMDHGSVNAKFCEELLAAGGVGPAVLDVGTGTALIPVELCRREPAVRVVAIDLARHMLGRARQNVVRAGFQDRIMLEIVDAKRLPYPDGAFATVVSNSIVHHIPEPAGALREMFRVTAPGGRLFVRDLARPDSDAEVDRLVELYGGSAPEDPALRASFERQRELLRASLHAALTADEVAQMAADLGIPRDAVAMTSDRHWTLAFARSPNGR
jgi:ubiquinone/menaquinone biosynthesis C-methylase UbiE